MTVSAKVKYLLEVAQKQVSELDANPGLFICPGVYSFSQFLSACIT